MDRKSYCNFETDSMEVSRRKEKKILSDDNTITVTPDATPT